MSTSIIISSGFKLRDSSSIDLISPNHTRLSNQNYFGESKLVVNYEKLSTSKEYFDLPGPVPEDIEVVVSNLVVI